jgi:dihydrofolate reductase
MIISAIAAVDSQMAIGKANTIPWHSPADLAFFKQKTLNQHILMGYQTFLSLPKRLAKRHYLILTRKKLSTLPLATTDLCFLNNWTDVLTHCEANKIKELWIIGGAQIYEQLLDFCHYLHLSRINTTVENADVFFPAIPKHFELQAQQHRTADEHNLYDIDFQLYKNLLLTQ